MVREIRWIYIVSFLQDMNKYLYGKLVEDTEKR
jgi:hypothetical protein